MKFVASRRLDLEAIQPLLILGTSWFAPEVADLASEIEEVKVTAFVENMDRSKCDSLFEGLPVLWVEDVVQMAESHRAICSIGSTMRKKFTDQVEALGLTFSKLIHPSARVSSKSRIGEGSLVSVGSVVAAHSTIGRHVIVNRGCLIGHHTSVGDWSTIGPGANVAGRCEIGTQTYVGMSAVILDGIRVGSNSVVGAGSVVTKDVPDSVQVLGIPARIVKEGIEGR